MRLFSSFVIVFDACHVTALFGIFIEDRRFIGKSCDNGEIALVLNEHSSNKKRVADRSEPPTIGGSKWRGPGAPWPPPRGVDFFWRVGE